MACFLTCAFFIARGALPAGVGEVNNTSDGLNLFTRLTLRLRGVNAEKLAPLPLLPQQVYGDEWSFLYYNDVLDETVTGVNRVKPREHPDFTYKTSVYMGML